MVWMSNSQWSQNQCALDASVNKTNFLWAEPVTVLSVSMWCWGVESSGAALATGDRVPPPFCLWFLPLLPFICFVSFVWFPITAYTRLAVPAPSQCPVRVFVHGRPRFGQKKSYACCPRCLRCLRRYNHRLGGVLCGRIDLRLLMANSEDDSCILFVCVAGITWLNLGGTTPHNIPIFPYFRSKYISFAIWGNLEGIPWYFYNNTSVPASVYVFPFN